MTDDYESLYAVTATNMARRDEPIITDTCPHGCRITASIIPNHAEAILRKLTTYYMARCDDGQLWLDGYTEGISVDLTPEEFTYLTNLLGDETP